MTATNYKLEKSRDRFMVTKDGVVVSNGFLNEIDALHSIFVIKGSVPNHYYIQDGSDVYLLIKEE
jgi:hypothetical protein